MAIVLLLALATGGCGGDSDGSTSSEALPKCSSVWVVGKTLAEDYSGCQNADGSIEAAVTYDCADGTTATSYDDKFGAHLGGEIVAAETQLPDC